MNESLQELTSAGKIQVSDRLFYRFPKSLYAQVGVDIGIACTVYGVMPEVLRNIFYHVHEVKIIVDLNLRRKSICM
jgi:hypothetical protein